MGKTNTGFIHVSRTYKKITIMKFFTAVALFLAFFTLASAEVCTEESNRIDYTSCNSAWQVCQTSIDICRSSSISKSEKQICYDSVSQAYDLAIKFVTSCECEHEAGSCSSSTMIAASIMAIFARFLF